jgi:hypothetical protein
VALGLYTSCINPYGVLVVAFPPVLETVMSTAETPAQANKPTVRSFMFTHRVEILRSSKGSQTFGTREGLIVKGQCRHSIASQSAHGSARSSSNSPLRGKLPEVRVISGYGLGRITCKIDNVPGARFATSAFPTSDLQQSTDNRLKIQPGLLPSRCYVQAKLVLTLCASIYPLVHI